MQHDDLIYAGHILDMARKAVEKLQGLSRADFDQDENLRLALSIPFRTWVKPLTVFLAIFGPAIRKFPGIG